MLNHLTARWPPTIKNLPARRRRCVNGAAIVTPLLLIGVLSCAHPGAPAGSAHPGAPADSGLAGCTSLLNAHPGAASGYPKIRVQFVGSRWPDLRTAGTAYVDLAMQLRTARGTDGYQTVWFYQRLSAACAKHRLMPDAGACQNGYAPRLIPGSRPVPGHQDRAARTCEATAPAASAVVLHCQDRVRCPEQGSRRQRSRSQTLTGPFRISGSALYSSVAVKFPSAGSAYSASLRNLPSVSLTRCAIDSRLGWGSTVLLVMPQCQAGCLAAGSVGQAVRP